MRTIPLLACLASILTLAACGSPDTPGAKAAHARDDNFGTIGKNFKGLSEELKKDAPNLEAIRSRVTVIDSLAGQVKTWFPAGSGPQDGVKTHALATVWQQPAEFEAAATRFADAAGTLKTAAQGTDIAAVRGAVVPLGASCKNCHDRFREKD